MSITCAFRMGFIFACLFLATFACCLAGSLATASNAYADDDTIDVLFVGNSLTHRADTKYNGIDVLFKKIAEAQGKKVNVALVKQPRFSLGAYAFELPGCKTQYNALANELEKGTWDYIVLQERTTTLVESTMSSTVPAVREIKRRAEEYQPGVKIMLFSPNGYNDSTRYHYNGKSRRSKRLKTQLLMEASCNKVASLVGGVGVINAGMYLQKCAKKVPNFDLLEKDSKHPQRIGYFIEACVVYKKIIGAWPKKTIDHVNLKKQKRYMKLLKGAVKLNLKYVPMLRRDHVKLKVTKGGKATFFSTDPKIATVTKKGLVFAKRAGTAIIYVQTKSKLNAACLVTVESDKLARGRLVFMTKRVSIEKGLSAASRLQIGMCLKDHVLEWSIGDETIASVNETGVISAKSAGLTTVTVTDPETGYTSTCNVRVQIKKPTKVRAARSGAKPVKNRRSCKVTWNPNSEAVKYRVFRYSEKLKKYKLVGRTTNTYFIDRRAPKNKPATYRVVAVPEDQELASPKSLKTTAK